MLWCKILAPTPNKVLGESMPMSSIEQTCGLDQRDYETETCSECIQVSSKTPGLMAVNLYLIWNVLLES